MSSGTSLPRCPSSSSDVTWLPLCLFLAFIRCAVRATSGPDYTASCMFEVFAACVAKLLADFFRGSVSFSLENEAKSLQTVCLSDPWELVGDCVIIKLVVNVHV